MLRRGCSRSLKVIELGTNRKPVGDLLLVFHCNYMYIPIFCRFRDITIYWSKIYEFCRFTHPAQSSSKPSHWGPWTHGIKVSIKKLESLGYPTVETSRTNGY